MRSNGFKNKDLSSSVYQTFADYILYVHIRVVKLLLIVIVIVIVMKRLWRESNSNSNRLLKIPE